ncbi:hypothetical protein Q670_16280 [Alcanivorax sp. P2S70]|uniref:hypothetical protein n=1 Tax=Alcanivorax sp. P2S70 TaxID=1397527 RepID=UPI0003B77B48|nr:hypothetical protein [Alcanivorax sp. P2S70]ERP88049.1 hypothetical protein Q670_16280 [Alcanivorax sp. P2S70]
MNKIIALLMLMFSMPCVSAEIDGDDVPLWERCNELVELDNNVGGMFTTSLKESAYAGSCSGTLKTLYLMSAYTDYRCEIFDTLKAANVVVKRKVETVGEALIHLCRWDP